MPLQAQNPRQINVNAVAAQDVHMTTFIRPDGQLSARVMIRLAGGEVDQQGKWQQLVPLSRVQPVIIPDVLELPADMSEIAPDVMAVFGGIVSALDKINAAKKLV